MQQNLKSTSRSRKESKMKQDIILKNRLNTQQYYLCWNEKILIKTLGLEKIERIDIL